MINEVKSYKIPVELEYNGSKVKLPLGSVVYQKRLHQKVKGLYSPYIAHAHFMYGVQVYSDTCEYCVGKIKPKKTPEQLAARAEMKRYYYLKWKNEQQTRNT